MTDKLSAIFVAVLLAGCSAGSVVNQESRNETYSEVNSPYEGSVELVFETHQDTIRTRLSGGDVIEVETRRRCVRQTVLLRAESKLHVEEGLSTVEAFDYDCDLPAQVKWDNIQLRGPKDQRVWENNRRVRNRAVMWMKAYLTSFYVDHPGLKKVR